MNQTTNRDNRSPNHGVSGQRLLRSLRGRSKIGGIVIVVLIAAYSFAAPRVNERFDWNLPQIRTDAQGNVQLAESNETSTTGSPRGATESDPMREVGTRTSRDGEENEPELSSRADAESTAREADSESGEELLYGMLREVSRDRYLSPAGLMYGPGSAEGHRLEHLRRHTKDDPNRPGSHGVFDGEMEGALKTIDRAYDRAKNGQRTTTKIDDGRTIHTVDMGGRVGYVGGREGRNRRNPMARRVRIVLEDNRLITAYPL